jgi:hypothetical protein
MEYLEQKAVLTGRLFRVSNALHVVRKVRCKATVMTRLHCSAQDVLVEGGNTINFPGTARCSCAAEADVPHFYSGKCWKHVDM